MFMLPLPRWIAIVGARLRQGVRVRAIRTADGDALAALLLSLSARTCYLRYLSRRTFDTTSAQAEAQQIIRRSRGGIVLVAYAPSNPATLLGLVELVVDPDNPQTAEIALVVRDAHQGQRIGTLLARQALYLAERLGITMLRASTFAKNIALRELLDRLGRAAPVGYEDGVLELLVTIKSPDLRLNWVA